MSKDPFKTRLEIAKKKVFDKENKKNNMEADVVLISVGRRPYTTGLKLENVGVKTDEKGKVKVDKNFETNIKNIFAIGDIIGGPWLAHKAMHDAINCINYIVSGKSSHKPKTHEIPGCIYSLPQIATVGFTEQQLKENKK